MVEGIDICPSIQGRINWHAVAGAGLKFVYVQATNGNHSKQDGFDAAYQGAKSEALRVGAYHFWRDDCEPYAQIEYFLGHAGTIAGDDLPPMLDVEKLHAVSPSIAVDNLIRCIEHVESLSKRRPVLYTGPSFWKSLGQFGALDIFARYPLWIAHYGVQSPTVPAPWTDWVIWQKSGDGGPRVPGIAGDVDIDVCQWDLDNLIFDSKIASDTDPPWRPMDAADVLPPIFSSTDDSPTLPGTPTSKSSQSMRAVKP